MALTKVSGSIIKDSVSLSGNVSVGGTLTYQDVTNVDALGIGTFRTGIKVLAGQVDIGSNIKLGNAGVVTATSFVGSGANLTGVTALSGSTNNTLVTVTGANAIQGESNLTYDGTNLQLTTDANNEGIKIDGGVTYPVFEMTANRGAGNTLGKLISKWNGTEVASIQFVSGTDASNKDDGYLYFNTRPSGGSMQERLRIQSNGRVNIGVNPNVGAQSLLNLKGDGDDGNQTVLLRLGNDSSGSGTGAAIVMGAGAGASSQGVTLAGFYDGTGTAFTIGTNASFNGSTSERLRIASDGTSTFDVGAPSSSNKVIGRFQAQSSRQLDIVWHDSGSLMGFNTPGNHSYIFKCNDTERLRIDSSGHLLPGTDNALDLGSSSKRWANIYTGDLQLSNEGKTNVVDGTWGNYTIQEGESDLFLINNRSGKKYKFNLTEVV